MKAVIRCTYGVIGAHGVIWVQCRKYQSINVKYVFAQSRVKYLHFLVEYKPMGAT